MSLLHLLLLLLLLLLRILPCQAPSPAAAHLMRPQPLTRTHLRVPWRESHPDMMQGVATTGRFEGKMRQQDARNMACVGVE
jgi:hypothetical protein